VKKLYVPLSIMTGLLVLDQLPKIWVRSHWPLNQSTVLVPNFLAFTHVENRGVSFNILGDLSDVIRLPLLISFSLLAVVMLSVYWYRQREQLSFWMEWAFLLIIPGATGNLIDRAAQGTVTDFLYFHFYDTSFFVNNLADILISLGVVAYILGTLRPDSPQA